MLQKGLKFESRVCVTDSNTALALGSGDMAVFATPAMVALMENAAMMCVADYLPKGSATVGTAISTSHVKASALGAEIRAEAELLEVDGRRLEFAVKAYEGDRLIGEGSHTRFVVDRERFLSKL